MYLPDSEIRILCVKGVIRECDTALIGPASIDVRLGPEIMIETPESPELQRFSIANTTRGNPYLITPQEFFLAHTVEKFFLPASLSAEFRLKSSRGREGLSHALAVFCDPGFTNSHLTLELHSIRRYHPVAVWSGMRIGQMIFSPMEATPEKSYAITGRYNNSEGVVPSRG